MSLMKKASFVLDDLDHQVSVDEQLVDDEIFKRRMPTLFTSTLEKLWAAITLSGSSCSSLPSTRKLRLATILAKLLTIVEAAIPTAYEEPVSTDTSK
mmetsp:Transcript_38656/g.75035  ORF Transcript_38656/g.75035 Transcript_38656/m.75035 type:complete len:97 (-) Transcript_38656:586-876(-)